MLEGNNAYFFHSDVGFCVHPQYIQNFANNSFLKCLKSSTVEYTLKVHSFINRREWCAHVFISVCICLYTYISGIKASMYLCLCNIVTFCEKHLMLTRTNLYIRTIQFVHALTHTYTQTNAFGHDHRLYTND